MDKIEKKNKKIFIPIAEPVLKGNELKYISNCIKTGWISSQGKYVIEFEKIFSRFCGSSYGVSTSNGTMALHLALKTLGIGLDDEVIVPTLTFVATEMLLSIQEQSRFLWIQRHLHGIWIRKKSKKRLPIKQKLLL